MRTSYICLFLIITHSLFLTIDDWFQDALRECFYKLREGRVGGKDVGGKDENRRSYGRIRSLNKTERCKVSYFKCCTTRRLSYRITDK